MNNLFDSFTINWEAENESYYCSIVLSHEMLHKFDGEGPSRFDAIADLMVKMKSELTDLSRVSIGCLTEVAVSRRGALSKFMGIE